MALNKHVTHYASHSHWAQEKGASQLAGAPRTQDWDDIPQKDTQSETHITMSHAHKQLTRQTSRQTARVLIQTNKQTGQRGKESASRRIHKDTAGKGACQGTGQNGNSC